MLLDLSSVTLLSIDCHRPDRTLSAMRWSRRFVKFSKAVLVTDLEKFPRFRPSDVCLVPTRQSDRKTSPPGLPNLKLAIDYELAILRETPLHFTTSHVLYQEWDSAVLNPSAWDTKWLQFDYVGAPWPHHTDLGWPPCDITNSVGNGGFSLKSKRLCEAVRLASLDCNADPAAMLISDAWICRTIRPSLEAQGLKFASPSTAARFSCENQIYSGQFGFHGKATARLNGWGADFATIK